MREFLITLVVIFIATCSSAAPAWQVFGRVNTLALQGDKVLVGGQLYTDPFSFEEVHILRCHLSGQLDDTFEAIRLHRNLPFAYANVNKLLVLPDNRFIHLGGWFLAGRYLPNGEPDTSFKYSSIRGHEVYDGTLQNDSKLLVVGVISHMTWEFDGIFRLNPNGSFDPDFKIHKQGYNFARLIAVDAVGRILVNPRSRGMSSLPDLLMRFMPDGQVDLTFQPLRRDPRHYHSVEALAVQTDNKVLIAEYAYDKRTRFFRINENGTDDGSFTAASTDGRITTILNAGDHIFVGGGFTNWGRVAVPGIVRLDSEGKLDQNYYLGSGTDDSVKAFLQLPNGNVLVGGHFTRFKGIPCPALIELDSKPILLRDMDIQQGAIGISVAAPRNLGIQIDASTNLQTWFTLVQTNLSHPPQVLTLSNASPFPALFLRGKLKRED